MSLTEKGRHAFEEAHTQAISGIHAQLVRLSPTDRADLIAAARTSVRILRTLRDTE